MNIFLGKTGLKESWQAHHKETMKCNKCGGVARIMFVAMEDDEEEYVCGLHENMKDEKYWPHDAISCAVYLCEKCFEPNAIINQA